MPHFCGPPSYGGGAVTSTEESAPLLQFLNAHATRYELVYRHRWAIGDLLMWDNRCALHYAVPDYDQRQLRRMQRCTILGSKQGYLYAEDADRLEGSSNGSAAGSQSVLSRN